MKYILVLCLFLSQLAFGFEKKDTLEIGFVYWKKDDAPGKYNAYLYGINKAIENINKNGGIANSNINLSVVPYNEKGNVDETIKIAKEISQRENMISVIGFSNSKRALPSIGFVSNSNIPIISSAGSKKIFDNDVNNIFFTTNFGIYGEMLYLEKFIKAKNYKNFVFISKDGDNYSDEYYEETSNILKATNKINANSIDEQLKNIKNNLDKDTLVIISIDVASNAKIAKKLRDNGVNNDIFFGRGGIVGDEFYAKGGYGLKNIYELSTLLAGASNETILKFKNDNLNYFKNEKNERYLEYAAYGYDSVNLIAKAYSMASYKVESDVKVIRENIKRGLSMINDLKPYDGVATTYSFGEDRIGGKLMPQYILESTGKKPSLYKKQYIYKDGVLTYVPALYTNIDIKSINILNQEASEYSVEIMLTLISEKDITLDDIEFENIVISNSSFEPSIYAKEFIVPDVHESNGLNVKIYNVKAQFRWKNRIENFPFDSQKLPILIKPKNPVDNNFINFFISDIDSNLNSIDISGWEINGGYAGFKKGNYEYIGTDLEKQKEYYYRSSFTIDITRSALSSAIKFILPLAIVLLVTIVLFILPDDANGDKVGAGTNMLITVAALYFTYATLVEVDYVTFVDKLYMFSLGFVLVANVLFIHRQRFNAKCNDFKCENKYSNISYVGIFGLSIILYIAAVIYFFQKSNFF